MLTPQNTEVIRRIEEAIGYTFNDKRLLVQVLTRKTYLKIDPEAPDNEVLEFYGDTLMNYHVTNYFMSKYAHMLDDGLFFMRTVEQFTDMRSHYVCNRYLTDRIKAMGLARYLRAQNRDSELRRDGEKAYADIFESLVGAIYLDSYQNDNLIRAFILRQLGIEPKRLPEEIEAFNFDSLAYEIPEISEFPPIPAAEPSSPVEEPDAAPEAVAEEPAPAEVSPVTEAVADTAEEVPSVAEVPAREEEPQAKPAAEPAAEVAAEALEEATPPLLPPASEPVAAPMPMQEALAEFCRRQGFDQPTYGETPKNAPNARPVAACTMKYKDAKGKIVKISLNDSGKTLAEATEKAAAKMLRKLEKQVEEATRKVENPPKKGNPPAPSAVTPVAEVIEAAVQAVLAAAAEAETSAESTVTEEATPIEVDSIEAVAEAEASTAETLPVADAETVAEAPASETDAVAEAVTPEAVARAEDAPAAEVIPEATPVEATPMEAVSDEAGLSEEAAPAADETVAEAPAETAESAPAEATKPARTPRKKKTEATDGDGKPVRKSPGRKKSTPKAEGTAEAAPAEPDAEGATEPSEAPVREAKPRPRKPRAKKPVAVTEATDTAEPSAIPTEAPSEE